MVTLKDIAKEAGVSIMTVSRVVNKQYSKVSDANIKQIEAIIKAHGYIPNSSARSLSSKTSKIIGVLIQGEENALQYPYNSTMVGNICYYVQSHGYSPMLFYVNDYKEITKRLRTWNVDGAIFLGMFDESMKSIQKDNRIPLIFTDSYSSLRQVTNIGIDDFKGGELAANYLINKGHTELGFLGTSIDTSSVVRQRLHGYQHAIKEAGLELKAENIIIDNLDSDKLLNSYKKGVTSFFATADILALDLMKKLKNLGLKVPDDISVIGFDNLYFSDYTNPALTSIGQDIEKKAQLAVEVLFKHIAATDSPSENIILDVTLVERESVRTLI